MQTFLTPEPITIEIRNASGEIRVDLADVATTTVDVVAATSHPLGFLDDVIRAAKAQFAGSRSGFDSGSAGFDSDTTQDDPTERVRIEHRPGARRTTVTDLDTAVGRTVDSAPVDNPPVDNPSVHGLSEHGLSEDGPAESDAVLGDSPDRDTASAASGGTVIVDTDPARDGWKSSFTVHVTAPLASGIRIQSQSADITVTGRSDRLEARTASGDIRVEEVTGRSVVQTASGEVTIATTGQCDVRTASGDIAVHAVRADAVVHSTSGDITLDNTAGNVNARSVSGDIQVLDVTSGSAELVTVSGDVEVGIHAGSLTSIDLNTVSGNTDTDFQVSADAPVAEDETVDEAVLDLRVKTTSGNIRLRRATVSTR